MMILADLWFMLFLGGFGLLGILAVEIGSLLAVGAIVLSFVVLLKWFFEISAVAVVIANPMLIVPIIVGYIIMGSMYAGFWRWPDYLRSKADDIQGRFVDYCKSHNLDRKESAFVEFSESTYYKGKYGVGVNKEMLSVWVLMWPFALLWELSHRPITWIWNTVYNMLGNMFTRVGVKTARRNIKFDD